MSYTYIKIKVRQPKREIQSTTQWKAGNNMGETIEKRLKDYKGFQVYKITDNKGTRNETITYMLNDQDGNNIDCFTDLAALKKFADNY